MSAGAKLILLTATPVRNRRAELEAQLSLFLGPRGRTLTDAELARCVVRRGAQSAAPDAVPHVTGPCWHAAPPSPDYSRAIASLPPPLPVRDGAPAHALVVTTLARCWTSSLAALDTALKRRLQRGAALEAALDAGRLPTRAELRAWVVGDDAVQLAFPLMSSGEAGNAAALRAALHAHLEAVRRLRARVAPHAERDAERRAEILRTVRASHAGQRVVAFTAYVATAEAIYRALRADAGVALLTSRGARTAGGARRREEILAALASARGAPARAESPHASRLTTPIARDDITLVLATDLLSEGVNLQGTPVVVHLDSPWTPAGLGQRVGRAARMGSASRVVHVYAVRGPQGAERLLHLAQLLERKIAATNAAYLAPRSAERLRRAVGAWLRAGPRTRIEPQARVAAVNASAAGFLAAIEGPQRSFVLGARATGHLRWQVSDDPALVTALVEAVHPRRSRHHASRAEIARAVRAISAWLARRAAAERSGIADPASPARRRVLARLDAAVERAPPHHRPIVAARVGRLRDILAAMHGAGVEFTLAELDSAPETEETFLDRLDAAVRQFGRDTRPAAGRAEVTALLFLRATSPPSPPAAETGSAAPR
jgi:hypothetical protein